MCDNNINNNRNDDNIMDKIKEYFKFNCKICGKPIGKYNHDYTDSVCFDCMEDKHIAELAKDLQANKRTSTHFEKSLICPHCGHKIDDSDGYFVNASAGKHVCPSCDKEFTFVASVQVSYSTVRA